MSLMLQNVVQSRGALVTSGIWIGRKLILPDFPMLILLFWRNYRIKEYPSYELFGVTETGNIKQLTHLTDYYPRVYIEDLSWSPDSRYIAFWFTHWHLNENPSYNSMGSRYLAVLDTTTELVTSYCINGERNATIGIRKYPAPLWSPDSKQVVVQSQTGEDFLDFQTILVDVQKNRAFLIAQKSEPVGWLVSP